MRKISLAAFVLSALVVSSCSAAAPNDDDASALTAATQEIEAGRPADQALNSYQVSKSAVLAHWETGDGSKLVAAREKACDDVENCDLPEELEKQFIPSRDTLRKLED